MIELACINLEFCQRGKSVDDVMTENIEVRLSKEQREEISKQINKKDFKK